MPLSPTLLRRTLTPKTTDAGLRHLAEVVEADGTRRCFLGQGSDAQALEGTPREIGGGFMTEAASDLPASHERAVFAGQDVLMGFRLAESAEAVAEWLAYHHAQHGATAALIVNRADPQAAPLRVFEDALEAALRTRALPMTVMVLSPTIPLGKSGLGPETHPYLAPDAPGKDRMTPPAADPWLSPLGEGVILELLKWQWLGEARAVLLLDPCDYLAPAREASAFEDCVQARHGVVLLVGRRVYPWRLRKDQPARFADHICRQFDQRRGIARWGCAPQKAGLQNTWRMARVAFVKPDAGRLVPFWRAMGLRVGGVAPSELAPKTSLVEDAQLLALAQAQGYKPVRPPSSQDQLRDSQGQRTAIVTTMKNEGPFILEWLAWHRAIGVEDFLIYTNDCTDGTDRMLDLLMQKGLVQHRANPWQPGGELKPQHAALQAAETEPLMRNADWAICMDVDEFIHIKLGDGRLPTLYAAMEAAHPGANMISMTWRLFGNADVRGYEDRLITEQFTRCAPQMMRKPHQAWGFKTLFRNVSLYKKLGVHRPKGLKPDLWQQIVWLNGSGQLMPKEMLRNGWRSTLETYGYDWVQLNHYAVRSAESFLVKRDRGRVNHVDRDQGLHYWFRMNHNVESDPSLLPRLDMLRAEYDRLLADPDIRAMHAQTVAAHRAKIAELRATSNYEAFYGELTGPKLETLSQRTPYFGSSVFNAGPGAIPDEIALAPSLPKDFYFTLDASEIEEDLPDA